MRAFLRSARDCQQGPSLVELALHAVNRASLASIKPCIEPALCVGSMPALTDSMGTVLAFKCESMARIALTALTAGAAGRPIYSEMKQSTAI